MLILMVKCKDKFLPVLFLTEHHAMKAYWRCGCVTPRILDPATGKEPLVPIV